MIKKFCAFWPNWLPQFYFWEKQNCNNSHYLKIFMDKIFTSKNFHHGTACYVVSQKEKVFSRYLGHVNMFCISIFKEKLSKSFCIQNSCNNKVNSHVDKNLLRRCLGKIIFNLNSIGFGFFYWILLLGFLVNFSLDPFIRILNIILLG